jgi:hypothetical protein
MEALVYILLIGTFNRNFLCRIFREAPEFLKKNHFIWFFLSYSSNGSRKFSKRVQKLYRQNMW